MSSNILSRFLAENLKPHRTNVLILVLLLFGSILSKLIAPKFIGLFLDKLHQPENHGLLYLYIFSYVFLSIFQNGLQLLLEYRGDALGWVVTNELRQKLFSFSIYSNQSFHEIHSSGKLVERIDGDITYLSNFFSLFAVKMAINFLSVSGTIILFGLMNLQLGIIFLAFAIISVFLLYKFRNIAVSKISDDREQESQYSGFLAEHYEGFRSIFHSQSGFFVLNRLRTLLKKRLSKKVIAQRYARITGHIGLIVTTTGNILAIVCTYYLFKTHRISLGNAFLIFFYIQFVLNPLDEFVDQVTDFQSIKACVKRLNEFFVRGTGNVPEKIVEAEEPTSLSITFRNIHFSYQNIPILKNLSFEISEGETIGIIGATGSGKSTILKLIFKLYQSQEGTLLIGETNINKISKKRLRSLIGYDVQEVSFFNATVRENLCLFDNSYTDEELIKALNTVGLNEWLDRLALGLDSEINNKDLNLSGGQGQLFKLARLLLLKSAEILLFDEPTSKLDKTSELQIIQTIEKLCRNKTAIIVTHKPEILTIVDRVLVIDDGVIIDSGTRSEMNFHIDSSLN